MEITLDSLLAEVKEIKTTIHLITKENFLGSYSYYDVEDSAQYERWKHKAIRFLRTTFPGDESALEFENTLKGNMSARMFDRLIGILEAYKDIPTIIPSQHKPDKDHNKSNLIINVNQEQANIQHQEQTQQNILNIFIDSIKDELQGRQLKEVQKIIKDEPDPHKAKIKIIDKLKSFGENVASNIVANIITNPAIWSNL